MGDLIDVNDLKAKLETWFERLQSLDIPPTLANMEKMVQTLYDMRDVYIALGGEEDGGCTPDPGKRDSN